MGTKPDATVTVGVPVWNAEMFVAETLTCILRQTLRGMRVLVSVDRSDDRSLAICQQLADEDDRMRVVAQADRLGWVGNVNWLLERVETPYACILPHDDLVRPDYLESLLGTITSTDDTVLAFCDIETFGTSRGLMVGTDMRGRTFDRLLRFLAENDHAIAWRGVFRTAAARRAGPLDATDAAADIGWLLRLTVQGALVRVPRVLYRKRLHPESVTAAVQAAGAGSVGRQWTSHCAACRRIVLAARDWTAAERRALTLACQIRLLASPVRSPLELFDLADAYTDDVASAGSVGGELAPRAVVTAEVESYLRDRARAAVARYALRAALPPPSRRWLRRLHAGWRARRRDHRDEA